MSEQNLYEAQHLERWIVEHPEVIDDGLKVVTTQFSKWASQDGGTAREALDILALSSSGQTVVVELKRGGDRKVHLQVITYGALVAGFDRVMLAEAYAQWRRRRGAVITDEQALDELTEHLESGWDDEILKFPKLVLVAERFPDQVLTTVDWLTSTVAEALEIECHEYTLFQDDTGIFVSFQKRFPVETIEGSLLRPLGAADSGEVKQRIATIKRRARSVAVITQHHGIPDGASMDLDVATLVKPAIVAEFEEWFDADPVRSDITWVTDPIRPLRWAAHEDPSARWTPTALRNELFAQAGVPRGSFSAADAFRYRGRNLYSIAAELHEEASGTEED